MMATIWIASARQGDGMEVPIGIWDLPCTAHRPQYLESTLESLATLEGLGAFALYISQVCQPGSSCVSALRQRPICM